MKSEIGSEFWTISLPNNPQTPPWEMWHGEKHLFLSGRTALSAIIDDIVSNKAIKKAYLPSYCCRTMIEPFISHEIEVEFYPVVVEHGQLVQKIDIQKQCDVVLTMNYFGFSSVIPDLPREAIVIRDMTHSLFTAPQMADYLFASLRKWGPVSGAAIASKQGVWSISEPTRENEEYHALRRHGYDLKAQFMRGELVEKQDFLKLFSRAEDLLDHDYHGYKASEESLRVAGIFATYVSKRKENSKVLLEGLKGNWLVQPVFSYVGENDVPLFVPILVRDRQRDELRKFLVKNNVFCPVHWPISELHEINMASRELYTDELSLVCDQRYGVDDMRRIIELICLFCGSNQDAFCDTY